MKSKDLVFPSDAGMKVVPRKNTKIPTLKQEGLLRHKSLHARQIKQRKQRLRAKGHGQRMMWNQEDVPLQLAGTHLPSALKVALSGHM